MSDKAGQVRNAGPVWMAGALTVLTLLASPVHAQFLRIGPFDFMSEAMLEGVYTTNVEGQRPSDATENMQDIYFIAGIDLSSQALLSPNSQVTIDTGLSVERHLRRPDLDDSSNPFGQIDLGLQTEFGWFTFRGNASAKRNIQMSPSVYNPEQKKTRNPNDEYIYRGALEWRRRSLAFVGSYDMTRMRYVEEEFQTGDQDTETLFFEGSYALFSYAGLFYNIEQKTTTIIQSGEERSDVTEKAGLSGAIPLSILRRPRVTYTFGVESKHGKDDPDDQKWVPMHTIAVEDRYEMSSILEAGWNVVWQNKVAEDDISFTYAGDIRHRLSRTAEQRFTASREPADTFGSTKQTDRTEFDYSFLKSDLFIYNLNGDAGVTYTINTPMDQGDKESEKVISYRAGLQYERQLSRRLRRTLAYRYTREDSNLIEESLIEQRVTLTYRYTF